MANAKQITQSESALQEAQALLQLWLRVKQFLGKAFTDEPITREEEHGFLDIKSEVSKFQRGVAAKLPPDVGFGGERLQDFLRQAISIGHLRSLPKSDKQSLAATWHASFIQLCRVVGTLQFIAEGYVPQPKAAKQGTGLKDLRGGASKDKKNAGGGAKKVFKWLVILAIVGGAIYWFTNQ